MKFTKIIFGVTIASLLSTSIFAEENKTKISKTEATKTDLVISKSSPPIVGGTLLNISVTEIVTTGYRASELLKSDIYNQAGEKIGSIDDIIIAGGSHVSFAIISVGGFLGMGDRLVAVPAVLFENGEKGRIILPKATKSDLNALPEFKYTK